MMLYPMAIDRLFKKRIEFITGILFNWLRSKKDITNVRKPMNFKKIKTQVVVDELNGFMSDLIKFLFLEKFGNNEVNLIEKITYVGDIFKSFHLTTLLTRRLQDLIDMCNTILSEDSEVFDVDMSEEKNRFISAYSDDTKKIIRELIIKLEFKKEVKRIYG